MSPGYLLWLSLVAIIWLQSLNGTNTSFPSYSSQLKQQLSISQVQLNNLAFASDAGKFFGFSSAIAAGYLPLWVVLLFGSFLGFIGYGLQYLFLANHLKLSYVQIFALNFIAGNSICWINTVCYSVIIRNFPSDYSQVPVGITTSYQGLSAKIYTDIVHAAFSSAPHKPHKTAKAHLLLNSISPPIVSIIAAPLFAKKIDVVGRPRAGSMKVGFFLLFLIIAVVTGIYSVISSLGLTSRKVSPVAGAIVIAVFLLAPLLVPIIYLIGEVRKTDQDTGEKSRVCDFALEENGLKKEEGVDDREIREVVPVGVKEEIGVMLLLQRLDFWLFFFVYLFGATLGMVFLNNLGQIAESRGYSGTTDFVSWCSSFVFFGRIIPSLMDYCFSRKNMMISGPASLVLYMPLIAGAFFFLLLDTKMALYVSTAIIGACTGAITCVAVTITKELFGKNGFSMNYNLVIANIPVGSFAYNYMAALLYRKEGKGDGACMGMECYRTTFIIWGSLSAVGTFLAIILFARTRQFYSKKLQNMNSSLVA
ncbi:protein NUCLEAR FUSION DEFECTIVE 4-like [Corylus avellana]|uniref:protein NUCLEAR FUSION DEFECTIVE 4-like n=1 Tax=Corylus avellana TaxID=13451 RepID=UPI00286B0736|nr:protein NUCLEAR FUSION DEFECTIVE 4-like [Corylus avellana]